MGRIRTIKPEFWRHEDLSGLPEATHMLAAALLNYADDEGYYNAHPGLVRSECCPLREPSVSIHDSLTALSRIGFVELFDGTDGKRYGRVVKFDDHQRVNRPTPSKIKGLRVVGEHSVTTHAQLSESSPPEGNREGKRNREQGTGDGSSRRSDSSPAQPEDRPAELTLSAPVAVADRRAERLAQVTDDAIAAFNACPGLTKAAGGILPNVSATVGRERRRRQVERCLKTARAICREQFGSDRVTSEFWHDYFAEVQRDDFMAGRRRGGQGHENWTPDFEYLTRDATMLKVYDRAASTGEAA